MRGKFLNVTQKLQWATDALSNATLVFDDRHTGVEPSWGSSSSDQDFTDLACKIDVELEAVPEPNTIAAMAEASRPNPVDPSPALWLEWADTFSPG